MILAVVQLLNVRTPPAVYNLRIRTRTNANRIVRRCVLNVEQVLVVRTNNLIHNEMFSYACLNKHETIEFVRAHTHTRTHVYTRHTAVATSRELRAIRIIKCTIIVCKTREESVEISIVYTSEIRLERLTNRVQSSCMYYERTPTIL